MGSKWTVDTTTGCWEWALFTHSGYGRLTWNGVRGYRAHRWSYEVHVGPIPEGHEVDHLCRNRACVNPEHLEAVTREEHAKRSLNARKTHCNRGHEFTSENTYHPPRTPTQRMCRACNRIAVAKYKARRVA